MEKSTLVRSTYLHQLQGQLGLDLDLSINMLMTEDRPCAASAQFHAGIRWCDYRFCS